MSDWVLNSSGTIPFNNSAGQSSCTQNFYASHAGSLQHGSGQAVSTDVFTSQGSGGFINQQAAQGFHPINSLGAGQRPTFDGRTWQDPHNSPGQPSLIGARPLVQAPPGTEFSHASSNYAPKITELEQALQSVCSELSQQHEERRKLRSEVETLQAELIAERQRSNDLSRQLHAASAAHNVVQHEYDRLISQHSATVREHELMTDSLATALREQEARRADVARLQRQLEEAQAVAAIANAAAATVTAGAAASSTTAAVATASTTTTPYLDKSGRRTSPRGGGGGLSTAEEERWSLRLQKAERALEEERRVSEDLRHQLAAADGAARTAEQLLRQLEFEMAGGSGAGSMPPASSDPLPLSPGGSNTTGLHAASFPSPSPAHGLLAPASSGTGGGVAGVAGGGSGGGSMSGESGSGMVGGGAGYRPMLVGPMGCNGYVRAAISAGSGLGAMGVGGSGMGPRESGGGAGSAAWRQAEEQFARMRKEIEGLRSDVARLMAIEESQRVAVRAAEDRARAAESVSLDARKQCDQAARTIGRLIDENSELVTKVNAQSNALADCKTSAAAREAHLRALESRLQQALSQLAASQPVEASGKPADPNPKHPPDHNPTGETAPSSSPDGVGAGAVAIPAVAGHAVSASAAGSGTSSGDAHVDTAVSAPPSHPQRPLTLQRDVTGSAIPPPHASFPPATANAGNEQGKSTTYNGPGHDHSGARSEVPLPNEADWKLVMLTEEVRRLVEEVSLANTACMAMQQLTNGGAAESASVSPGAGMAATGTSRGSDFEPSSSPADALDLPRILSRLAGLAGRRLGQGETAAYIIELAGHMEALEGVLAAQQQRMAAMQTQLPAGRGPVMGSGGREQGMDYAHQEGGATTTVTVTPRNHEHDQSLAAPQQHQQQRLPSPPSTAGRVHSEQTDTTAGAGVGMVGSMVVAVGAADHGAQDFTKEGRMASAAAAPHTDSRGVSLSSSPPHSLPPPSTLAATTAQPVVVSPFQQLSQHAHPRPGPSHGPPMEPHPHPSSISHGTAEAHQAGAHKIGPTETDAAAAAHMQRSDLAAAAAAAVAAADAAAAAAMGDDSGVPHADGFGVHASELGVGTGAVIPALCEASQAPCADVSSATATHGGAAGGSGNGTAAVGSRDGRGAGPGVLMVGVTGVDGFDDDLLGDETMVVKPRPRKSRVGLWSWISGETMR